MVYESIIINGKNSDFQNIQFISAMMHISSNIVHELESLNKKSLWNSGQPKVEHSTQTDDYKCGGETSVDVETKLKVLKFTWIRRLCNNKYHPWKVVPRHYLALPNGELIFHRTFCGNTSFKTKIISLSSFSKDLL